MFSALKKIKIIGTLSRFLYRTGLKRRLIRKPMLFIYRLFGFKIIMRNEIMDKKNKYHVLEFGSTELISVKQPYNLMDITEEELGAIPDIMKKESVASVINKPFVFEVSDAELIGSTAIAFDECGDLIYETTMMPFQNMPPETGVPARALVKKLLYKPIDYELSTACSLVFPWNKNYHHWLVDSLSRLEGLEYYQAKTGIKPVLILESNLTNTQIESLKLLGYDIDNCLRWNMSKVRVKRLVIPSFRRQDRVSSQACLWLRQRMLSNLSDITNETLFLSPKVFISRSKALFRRIVNEDEVVEALAPLGFLPYTLEKMSFSDQVRLFSQAEVIVAPHGAGLTNMIFSRNPIIIELFGPRNMHNNVDFFALSESLGFRYGFLRCAAPPLDRRLEDSNMIVNISELLKVINKAVRLENK
jgi:hypothetical protein